jgi:hypothetical protein
MGVLLIHSFWENARKRFVVYSIYILHSSTHYFGISEANIDIKWTKNCTLSMTHLLRTVLLDKWEVRSLWCSNSNLAWMLLSVGGLEMGQMESLHTSINTSHSIFHVTNLQPIVCGWFIKMWLARLIWALGSHLGCLRVYLLHEWEVCS